MKRLVLSAALTIAAVSASLAQPTLTATNMNPVHGNVFYGHFVDVSDTIVTKGAAGSHVTWNFATVTEVGSDTTTFYACDSTPFCSTFSGSNIAQFNAGDYYYENTSATGVNINGIHSFGFDIVFSNPQAVAHYPFTYGSVFVDTSSASLAGLGSHYEIDSYICDGYGTIVLPSGTDTGVLRIHVITYQYDSNSFSGVTMGVIESYNWYKPGFHHPLMTINYDTAGSSTGMPYVSDASYYTQKMDTTHHDTVSAVGYVTAPVSNMRLYPNPSNDELHIAFNLHQSTTASLTITDLAGRVVATVDNKVFGAGDNQVIYNVANIPTGLYMVRLNTATGNITQKITISH